MAQSDRFYFWRGYYDALRMLPTAEQRDRFVMAICAYAFDGDEPDLGDDVTLRFAWQIVRDQVSESVAIGRDASRRGSLGGRPRKDPAPPAKSTKKTSAKTSALSSAKSSAKSSVKSCAESSAESCAESEGKGTERKGSETSPTGKVGFARSAGARSLASCDEPPVPTVNDGCARSDDDAPCYTPEQIASVMAALDRMAVEATSGE